MLYRITASHEDGYVETMIEAPAHNRFGAPPAALTDWVEKVWAPDVLRGMSGMVTFEIERYEPARIGYRPGNNGYAVSTTLWEFDRRGTREV